MKIVYQDKEILIEPKKIKTTVKDFLKYLKPKIDSSSDEELILIEKKSEIFDRHSCMDECTEIDLENLKNDHEFILLNIKQTVQLSEKPKPEPIEKLIMLTTNAKEEIKPQKVMKKRLIYNDDNLELLEHILSGPNLTGSSLRLRNEITSLLNNPFLSDNNFPSFLYSSNNSSSPMNNSTSTIINNVNTQSNNLPNSTVPVRQQPPQLEANPTFLQNLVDMGFPEDRAKRALIISKNNLNHATEMILNGYDLDMPDQNMYGGINITNSLGTFSQLFGNIQVQTESNNQNTNENQNIQEEYLFT
jgi:uncharacterized UBP type Zn finger protein